MEVGRPWRGGDMVVARLLTMLYLENTSREGKLSPVGFLVGWADGRCGS